MAKKVIPAQKSIIRLLADRILIKIEGVTESKTAGGIIIPTANTEEAPMIGVVIEVSERVLKCIDGSDKVEVGERIVVSKYAGSDISMEGVLYKVIRITDVFGVIPN